MSAEQKDRNRPDMVTDHFTIFGQIITAYAMAEMLLKSALAAGMNSDPRIVLALTDRMASISLINKAKALCAHLVDPSARETVSQFASRLEKAGLLRNHIAHSQWAAGTRENAIRPSGLSIRSKGGGCQRLR